MAKPRFQTKLLTTSLLCAGLSLLSACGGGGSDKPADPKVDLTPSATAATFSMIETRLKDVSGLTRIKLNVVDLRTGTVARSYDLVNELHSDEYPTPEWDATAQYKVDADGLGGQQSGISQMLFIQQRKVMALDLGASTLGTARQISSLANACAIDRDNVYLTPDGQRVWMRITTAGPDADCSKRDDNQIALISTDMSALDGSVASGTSSGLALIAPLPETTGQSSGVLVLNRDTRTVSVYDNTLKTKLYEVTVPDHTPVSTEVARLLASSPADRQQALIQLGGSVYLADWRGAQLQLGTPVTSVDATVKHPVVIKDTDTFYLGFGNQGLAINAVGTPVAATFEFPPTLGDIVDAWPTASGLVVKQAIRTASATSGTGTSSSTSTSSGTVTSTITPATPAVASPGLQASTLWSFNKLEGTYFMLASGVAGSTLELDIEGVYGDTVFFSRPNASSLWRDVNKVNATTGVATTIASNVGIVDHVMNPRLRPGSDSVKQLVWCEPGSLSTGCASSKLVAHDLATAQATVLGNIDVSSGWLSSRLFGVRNTWVGRNSLLELVRFNTTGYTSDIWMINPDTAGSLSAVTAAP